MITEHEASARHDDAQTGGSSAQFSPAASLTPDFSADRFSPITAKQLDEIPQLQKLSREDRFGMKVVSSVLPFRSNGYVMDSLIDWTTCPAIRSTRSPFPSAACWTRRISTGLRI